MSHCAFASFSGGKDCHLSIFLAKKAGFSVKYLLNMAHPKGEISCSHHLHSSVLRKQAEKMNLQLIQRETSWKNYEENYRRALRELRWRGVTHGVFGDIDLEEHREWVERVCRSEGIEPFLPLWEKERQEVARMVVKEGFKAYIIVVNDDFLSAEFLGRPYTIETIEELSKRGVDPCAEGGEFHTLVIDGPLYQEPLQVEFGEVKKEGKSYFLEVKLTNSSAKKRP
ncbi:MAG: diphthine--ammonia ligase [Candidatus Atribacteria bacterium]|nr:diphthine--ammonia ligase [Candidatus Atribacteria bacterium]MCD6350283.1 diphthine--ammonia ligase [Candidatus Atribacteria bacterium]